MTENSWNFSLFSSVDVNAERLPFTVAALFSKLYIP